MSAPITFSGTLGAQVGGAGGNFGCTNASNGVTGCMTAADWGLLHTATTTFSSPLSYSVGTNAVTCPTCLTAYLTDSFTHTSVYGQTTSATSTLLALTGSPFSLVASSTVSFVNASTTLLTVFGNAYFQASSTFAAQSNMQGASTTLFSTGTFWDTSMTSALASFDANHGETAYAGTTACVNQFIRSINGAGAATCNTVANADLANSSISFTSSDSSLSVPASIALGSSGSFTLNLANANSWTALQQFNGKASSTIFSSYGPAYFGATATSSFSTAGALTLITPLLIASGGTGQNTFTSSQLLYGNGTNALTSVATSSIGVSAGLTNTGTLGAQVRGTALTLKQIENRGFSYAASTAWTGTSTIQLGTGYGEVWNNMKCKVLSAGTLNVDFYHATTHFQFFNASTTKGTVNMAAAADTSGDDVAVDIGTPSSLSATSSISCTVNDTI